MLRAVALLLAASLLPGAAAAEDRALIAKLLEQHAISATTVSGAGDRAAFVVAEPPAGKETRTAVWVVERGGSEARRITYAGKDDKHPRWSPDGRTLGFISRRGDDKAPQVYLLPIAGGEAKRLTQEPGGVSTFEWSPDGRSLAFLTTAASKAPGDDGDDEIVASEALRPNLLAVMNSDGSGRRLLLPAGYAAGMFTWAGPGRLVVSASERFQPESPITGLYAIEAADGAMRALEPLRGVEFSGLKGSPDGTLVAFMGSGDGPTPHDLYVQSLAGGPARNLTGAGTRAAIDRPVADAVWTGPRTLTFSVEDGFRSAVYSVSADTGVARRVKQFNDQSITALGASGAEMVYARSSATAPAELFWLRDGRERQVTRLHRDFPTLPAPKMIRYAGADGLPIEAALYTPAGRVGRVPLVVLPHGGPSARWRHAITDWAQILVGQGVAVLAPNIRGSTGYGHAFMLANRNDWGGADFRDLMAGVDHVIAQGIADPERLGVAGWSYGGYMSAYAIGRTDRFKAAVIGAAMLDLETQFGTELAEIIPYDRWYVGTPWENPEGFRRMSPITHVGSVSTPALLLVGEEDPVDPIAQNHQFHRALRMRGVETDLVVYPREGHRLRERRHVEDMLGRMSDWLVTRLKPAS